MTFVERLGLTVGELKEPVASLFLRLVIDCVGNLQGGSAWSLGIGKYMELGYIERLKKLVCLFETLRCLSTTAYHNINSDEGIGHKTLYVSYLVGKELGVVVAVHELQHLVASALQRNVEMGHEGTARGTIVDKIVGVEVGFKAAYAIALYALHLVELTDEVDEFLTCGLAEVAYVHSREHYLSPTLCGSLTCLIHKRLYGRVAAETTGKGYGAIGAEIVAAVLHLKPEAGAVAA